MITKLCTGKEGNTDTMHVIVNKYKCSFQLQITYLFFYANNISLTMR